MVDAEMQQWHRPAGSNRYHEPRWRVANLVALATCACRAAGAAWMDDEQMTSAALSTCFRRRLSFSFRITISRKSC